MVQEPPALRIIIAASAAATLLYTPLLKRLTLVKNVAVAAVIALSPVSGALAAGAVRAFATLALYSMHNPMTCGVPACGAC